MSFSRLLFLIGVAVAIVLPVRWFVVEPIYIASASMEPTFPVGAHVFMDKITLKMRDPKRGEVVVFVPPVDKGHEVVKRVIGVAGDKVELKEKVVFVNDEELNENYVQYKRAGERLAGDTFGPITVPEGSLFVLGDNRDESDDSSVWKHPKNGAPVRFLPLKNVRGLVRGFY